MENYVKMMSRGTYKVLLIENEKDSAQCIMKLLNSLKCVGFDIIHKKTLADTLECVEYEDDIDIILLDLVLPNSKGIKTFETLKNMKGCSSMPIVIISDVVNIGIETVKMGAQDFIPKKNITLEILIRSMRYAIERKKNELELEKTQERLSMALDATSDGIWDYDITNNHMHISSKYENMLGYESGYLCGDIEKLLDIMHPEDKERIFSNNKMILCKKETSSVNDNVWKDEFRLKNSKGQYKWFLVRSMAINNDIGAPNRLIGVIVDITSRKIVEMSRKKLYTIQSNVLEQKLNEWNEEIRTVTIEQNEKLDRLNNDLMMFKNAN